MPLLQGNHICPHCGENLFWEYHMPERNGTRLPTAVEPNPSLIHPKRVNGLSSPDVVLNIQCNSCERYDEFTYMPGSSHNEA